MTDLLTVIMGVASMPSSQIAGLHLDVECRYLVQKLHQVQVWLVFKKFFLGFEVSLVKCPRTP